MRSTQPALNRNRSIFAAACLFLPFSASAEDPQLRDLLRDGLYAEEVTRDPEKAAKHYEFPDADMETKLAREILTALGGKAPPVGATSRDDEAKEITRLEALAKNAPDIILDPNTLNQAAANGWSKVVQYLLAAGSLSFGEPHSQPLRERERTNTQKFCSRTESRSMLCQESI